MKFDDVDYVYEIRAGEVRSKDLVNTFLSHGWRLLDIAHYHDVENSDTHYLLGCSSGVYSIAPADQLSDSVLKPNWDEPEATL